jgi:hypothetical protein
LVNILIVTEIKHDMAHQALMPPQYVVQHTQRGARKEVLFQIKNGKKKGGLLL